MSSRSIARPFLVFAVMSFAACARSADGDVRPAECAEVTRIRQQAQLARANAESEMGQASLALARRAASTDPVEVRNQQLENRRAAEVARRNAADHIGRARQLDGEASLKAAQLRAAGVECGRR